MTKEQQARLSRLREHIHTVRLAPTVPEGATIKAGVYFRALDEISFLIDLIDGLSDNATAQICEEQKRKAEGR